MTAEERSARLDKIFKLQQQFLESALADVREILSVLERNGDGMAAADGERLRKLAHDLKGTGAVYGFASLAKTAARMETACSSKEPVLEMRRCVDELVRAVDEARRDLKVLPSAMLAPLGK
jgi:HPt (histidine-containing phosphotransfer) domain-containing protein